MYGNKKFAVQEPQWVVLFINQLFIVKVEEKVSAMDVYNASQWFWMESKI